MSKSKLNVLWLLWQTMGLSQKIRTPICNVGCTLDLAFTARHMDGDLDVELKITSFSQTNHFLVGFRFIAALCLKRDKKTALHGPPPETAESGRISNSSGRFSHCQSW